MGHYILDTNILSETFRPDGNENVLRWLKRCSPEDLYLTAFTIGEIRMGAERLPDGKKRAALENWLENIVLPSFAGRVLAFDAVAAHAWARISANDKRTGRPRPTIDAMIAALAVAHGMSLVTRNVRDFEDLDIRLINPFAKG